MISKLTLRIKFMKKFIESCFKFVSLTKTFKEKTSIMFLKFFPNAMIMNIKIHNILNIIGFSKSMELDKCIHKYFFMKMYIQMFLMIFQSSMGPRKSKSDIPSGSTQKWGCPQVYQNNAILFFYCVIMSKIHQSQLYAFFIDLATTSIPYWLVFMNPSHCSGSRGLNHL